MQWQVVFHQAFEAEFAELPLGIKSLAGGFGGMTGSLMPKLEIRGLATGSTNWAARLGRSNSVVLGGMQPVIRTAPETLTANAYTLMYEQILHPIVPAPRK
jgi:hypothetical protein